MSTDNGLTIVEAKSLLKRGWKLTHTSWRANEYIGYVGKVLTDQAGAKLNESKFWGNMDYTWSEGWSKFDTNQHIKAQERAMLNNPLWGIN